MHFWGAVEEGARFRTALKQLLNAVDAVLREVSDQQVKKMIDILVEARKKGKKVLVIGAGRSGLVGRAFAMRLMHLGFSSYVLGDTITPPVGEGDVVVSISGSGTTSLVVTSSKAAKRVGAYLIAITSHPDSELASIADHVVVVKGRTKDEATKQEYFARQILGIHAPLLPLGTLFEDSCMLLLDSVIVELMARLEQTEEDMRRRHANIE